MITSDIYNLKLYLVGDVNKFLVTIANDFKNKT